MNMRNYSDEEFLEKVQAKWGNLKYFRWLMRENNLLAPRERLTDAHAELFKQAVELKDNTRCSWENAFKQVLNIEDNINDDNEVSNYNEDVESLREEVQELKRLVQEQDVRIKALEVIARIRE